MPSSSLLDIVAIGHLRDLKSKCKKLIEQTKETNPINIKNSVIDQIKEDFDFSLELKKEFPSFTTTSSIEEIHKVVDRLIKKENSLSFNAKIKELSEQYYKLQKSMLDAVMAKNMEMLGRLKVDLAKHFEQIEKQYEELQKIGHEKQQQLKNELIGKIQSALDEVNGKISDLDKKIGELDQQIDSEVQRVAENFANKQKEINEKYGTEFSHTLEDIRKIISESIHDERAVSENYTDEQYAELIFEKFVAANQSELAKVDSEKKEEFREVILEYMQITIAYTLKEKHSCEEEGRKLQRQAEILSAKLEEAQNIDETNPSAPPYYSLLEELRLLGLPTFSPPGYTAMDIPSGSGMSLLSSQEKIEESKMAELSASPLKPSPESAPPLSQSELDALNASGSGMSYTTPGPLSQSTDSTHPMSSDPLLDQKTMDIPSPESRTTSPDTTGTKPSEQKPPVAGKTQEQIEGEIDKLEDKIPDAISAAAKILAEGVKGINISITEADFKRLIATPYINKVDTSLQYNEIIDATCRKDVFAKFISSEKNKKAFDALTSDKQEAAKKAILESLAPISELFIERQKLKQQLEALEKAQKKTEPEKRQQSLTVALGPAPSAPPFKPGKETAPAVKAIIKGINTLSYTAVTLGLKADAAKEEVIGKLAEEAKKSAEALSKIAEELKTAAKPDDEKLKVEFDEYKQRLEETILCQNIDFSKPEDVKYAACKDVAEKFGVAIKAEGGKEKNAEEIERAIKEELEKKGFNSKQADEMAKNGIEFTRLRILTGMYNATKLSELADEGKLRSSADVLEERGRFLKMVEALPTTSADEFPQDKKRTPEQEAWIKKNCCKIQDGLYAQKLEGGGLRIVLDKPLTDDKINKIISLLGDKETITWNNIPEKDKARIEMACLRQGKKVFFNNGNGPVPGKLSEKMPENPRELGQWFGSFKYRTSWIEKLGRKEERRRFVQGYIKEEKLGELWRDVVKKDDPSLLREVLGYMTKSQKQMVATYATPQAEKLRSEIGELEQLRRDTSVQLEKQRADLEAKKTSEIEVQEKLKMSLGVVALLPDPQDKENFANYSQLSDELKMEEEKLKDMLAPSYDEEVLKSELNRMQKELKDVRLLMTDVDSKTTAELKAKEQQILTAMKAKQDIPNSRAGEIGGVRAKIEGLKKAIKGMLDTNSKPESPAGEKWKVLKTAVEELDKIKNGVMDSGASVKELEAKLVAVQQKLEGKKGIFEIIREMVGSRKQHTRQKTQTASQDEEKKDESGSTPVLK